MPTRFINFFYGIVSVARRERFVEPDLGIPGIFISARASEPANHIHFPHVSQFYSPRRSRRPTVHGHSGFFRRKTERSSPVRGHEVIAFDNASAKACDLFFRHDSRFGSEWPGRPRSRRENDPVAGNDAADFTFDMSGKQVLRSLFGDSRNIRIRKLGARMLSQVILDGS
ncbi:hypothetical protein SRABI123_00731 [Pseudomonas sp. Bi123]|nr:hypothetical protein SRABI123_00731 [Pseudomonas sp. Bi123]